MSEKECRFAELCRELYPDKDSMRQKCRPKTCDHYFGFFEGEQDALEFAEVESNGNDG